MSCVPEREIRAAGGADTSRCGGDARLDAPCSCARSSRARVAGAVEACGGLADRRRRGRPLPHATPAWLMRWTNILGAVAAGAAPTLSPWPASRPGRSLRRVARGNEVYTLTHGDAWPIQVFNLLLLGFLRCVESSPSRNAAADDGCMSSTQGPVHRVVAGSY